MSEPMTAAKIAAMHRSGMVFDVYALLDSHEALRALLRQREEEAASLKGRDMNWQIMYEELNEVLAGSKVEGQCHEIHVAHVAAIIAQLAASQARCTELEEALKVIASYARENGCCPYGCDTPYIAKQALTPVAEKELG